MHHDWSVGSFAGTLSIVEGGRCWNVHSREVGSFVGLQVPLVQLPLAIGGRRDASMLLQHAAEVVAVREAAVFRDLFDRLIGVAEQMAGTVEPVVEQDTHRSHADLGPEQMVQIPDTDTGGPGGIFSADLAGEVR